MEPECISLLLLSFICDSEAFQHCQTINIITAVIKLKSNTILSLYRQNLHLSAVYLIFTSMFRLQCFRNYK